MNLSKLAVVPIACVAVIIVLSGCIPNVMAEGPNTPAPSAEGLVPTDPTQTFADRLEEWTYDKDEAREANLSVELSQISVWLGLERVESPGSVPLSEGWVAVAPLGSMCFVAIGADGQTVEDGSIAVSILGREYSDPTLIELQWSNDYDWLKSTIDEFEPYCNGDTLPDLERIVPNTETDDQSGVNA